MQSNLAVSQFEAVWMDLTFGDFGGSSTLL
jgi:hypothetical protein